MNVSFFLNSPELVVLIKSLSPNCYSFASIKKLFEINMLPLPLGIIHDRFKTNTVFGIFSDPSITIRLIQVGFLKDAQNTNTVELKAFNKSKITIPTYLSETLLNFHLPLLWSLEVSAAQNEVETNEDCKPISFLILIRLFVFKAMTAEEKYISKPLTKGNLLGQELKYEIGIASSKLFGKIQLCYVDGNCNVVCN
jgi:hypothetical protein